MTRRQRDSEQLDLPQHLNLPYFTYGLFKPGELAHAQIAPCINGVPVEARVSGILHIRDGLPLLAPGGMAPVHGFLLRFRESKIREAYTKICSFEPRKHYRWVEVESMDTGDVANTLLGRSPEKGSIQYEGGEWTGQRDPVLTAGLSVVREATAKQAHERFRSAPPDQFDWPRLFRLQMAYLFLWTVIERFAALAYGPTLEPMQKIKRLGEDPTFEHALRRVVTRVERLYDSRNPASHADLDPERGHSSAKYYYIVRSNLSHRGKGAWPDGEIVRKSLLELQEIFRLVLAERMDLI
jgi:hypothetical protein